VALPAIAAAIARAAASLARVAGQGVASVGRGVAQAAAQARAGVAMGTRALSGATAAVPGMPPIVQQFFGAAQSPIGQMAQAVAQAAPAGGYRVPAMPPPMPQQNSPQAPWLPNLQQFNPGQLLNHGPSLTSIVENIRTGDKTVDGLKDVALALVTLPGKLKDFGAAVLEARRSLAEYSGDITNSLVKLEHDRFGRNIRLASATSGSTQGLAEAQSKLEERLLPYQAAGINTLNRMLAGVEIVAETGVRIFDMIEPVHSWYLKLQGLDPKEEAAERRRAAEQAGGAIGELARKIAGGEAFQRNMPPSDRRPRGRR
jgi:hypothetical protein